MDESADNWIEHFRLFEVAEVAGFVIYPKQPLPKDYPLRSLPNVVMPPHIGGYTEEGCGWKFIPAVENIIAFIEGRP